MTASVNQQRNNENHKQSIQTVCFTGRRPKDLIPNEIDPYGNKAIQTCQ